MASGHRLTLRALDHDPRADAIADGAAALGVPISAPPAVAEVVFVEGDLGADDLDALVDFLADPLLQVGSWDIPADRPEHVEITLLPGVTDTPADTVRHAGTQLGVPVDGAATGRRIEFPAGTDAATVDLLVRRVIANPIIERWSVGRAAEPVFHPGTDDVVPVGRIPLAGLDADGLAALGAARVLALDPEELVAIQAHFAAEGRDPTDVELETLAQTWSEHCAHKTFRADITLTDGTTIPSLLDQLRTATDTIAASFVRSAFVGNAGIVSFTPGTTVALKAETHNHPSAVEPFGGANTGVGGVIRDVMGAAHRPVALTDVLCFGPADVP
ncbi:MAG: phosphoribosylformylglycinamidine synthase subunit PurS, partial [Acidimicrobiia bacterium]|nr:phosphoribosylformylglycinamidine synthase subunit PurS [Acidimicrobiia bacterium]